MEKKTSERKPVPKVAVRPKDSAHRTRANLSKESHDLEDLEARLARVDLKPRTPADPEATTALRQVSPGSPSSQEKCAFQEPPMKDSIINLPEEFADMTDDSICPKDIERKTRNQSASDAWFHERKGRITASNFGLVTRRKKEVNDSFLQCVLNLAKPFFTRAVAYGRDNEKNAKEKYLQLYPDRHIHDVGLVVSKKFSFLGASPDGVVCDHGKAGLVEVKCPSSCKDLTIEECIKRTDFCLDSAKQLKRKHMYYAQVQGQMMITGHEFCDFVVYTQRDIHVERILADTDFMNDMLTKLARLYKDHAVAYLSKLKAASAPQTAKNDSGVTNK